MQGFKRQGLPTHPMRKTQVHVAYKITFTIPNFDTHGDLTDSTVLVDGINGVKLKNADAAIKRWKSFYPYASEAITVNCQEGRVTVSHTVIDGKSWILVSPWE